MGVYFCMLILILLVYIIILKPVSYCFEYYEFTVNFEIGNCEFSRFILLLEDFFIIIILLNPLSFHLNFRNELPKKPIVILIVIRQAINQFLQYIHLKNIKSSNLKTWNTFPLICSYLTVVGILQGMSFVYILFKLFLILLFLWLF